MIDRRKYIKDTYLRGINKYKHYFFEDKKNKCYISIKKILELDEPFFTRKGLCLINQNYYIVEIVPLHENYCIRVFVNDKKLFHFSYERYLVNQLRKEFGLVGTPIRMIAREKIEKNEKSNTK